MRINASLTLSWRRPLSYGNQSINLRSKSMNWFLYDNGLRHERVNRFWLKLLNKRLSHAQSHWKYVAGNFRFSFLKVLNLLSANPTKWSNALKQFVGKSRQIVWVRLAILCSSRLKVIEKLLTSQYSFAQSQPQKY